MKKINLAVYIIFLIIVTNCKETQQNTSIELHNNWQFAIENDTNFQPATVPGYVHTDLLDNHVIDSLYWGKNPEKYNFVSDTGWVYKNKFQLNPDQMNYANKRLVFEGLDTYADVFLNGKQILSTENMFLEYSAEVNDIIIDGRNKLEVHFKSPIKEAKKIIKDYPFHNKEHAKADADNYRKFVRKAQYQFGWDWACPLVPTGIYRPVKLQLYNNSHITDVYFRQMALSDETAILNTEVEIESDKIQLSKINIEIDNKIIGSKKVTLSEGKNNFLVPIIINNPQRWWPNGLGEQRLYRATVKLVENENTIDTYSQKIGLRTIEFVNQLDEQGKSYYFKVNDVPVFMKGANYVPIDAMIFMNFVMKKEILIYQDFMFASNMPAADEHFLDNVSKEAIYQVKRLRNHPCMALWAGSNEVESAWFEGFMPDGYTDEVYTNDHKKIFDELLPNIVKKFHPEISYVRSSPTTGTDSILVNTPGYGDTHAWGVWFSKIDFDDAKNNRLSRFISEYGFIGYPSYTSMQKYIPANEMDTASSVFKFRDAYPGIQNTIRSFIHRYYPQPNNLREFIYISGILQAEAMRVSNEIYRRNMPFCMGALLWQYNDVWPVASWSMVDYFGQWKPIMYRTKESFAPIILSTEQKNDSIFVHYVNDKLDKYNCSLNLDLQNFAGETIWSLEKTCYPKSKYQRDYIC